ncbi:C40 family peptidase [Marinobacter mobilis]|uniref:C40 family peptidase n=1 Tax=Marinobacter mobilis TaxID=488533 RepID=UPI0035C77337
MLQTKTQWLPGPLAGALTGCALALLSGCASQPQSPPLTQDEAREVTSEDAWAASPEAAPEIAALPFAQTDALTRLVLLQQVFERYQGVPYRYGGMSARGFDCSGFIKTAYREAFGHLLPRTTGQMVVVGQAVARDQLQPGDLVFFDSNGNDGHAGIFMGDDRFIHASTSSGVRESSLNSPYWRPRYSQARRLFVPAQVAADNP